MSTTAKIRAILNLITIIVGLILTILSIVAVVMSGSLNSALTELEKIVYTL